MALKIGRPGFLADFFPDLCHLPQDQINRKILWGKLFSQPPKEVTLWVYLLIIRKLCWIRLRIERFFFPSLRDIWQPSITSKRTSALPHLILIEGLDCSGKKTVAYAVQQQLLQRGFSCTLNIGPLGSYVYNYLVKLVSLHRFPDSIRSLVYTFEGWNDHGGLKRFQSNVVLQVSSPFRSWAYAKTFHKRARLPIYRLFGRLYAKYDQVWYLTVPYSVRVQRHKLQVAMKENPDSVERRFFGEKPFSEIEGHLQNLLRKYYGINGKFDTEVTAIDTIATIVTEHTIQSLEEHGK